MIDAKILKKYESDFPVRSLRVNALAQQALMRQAQRQAWFLAPKPSLIPEDVLTADPLTYQLTMTPDGTSLQNLGSELEQRQFLMKLGLSPPNEVVSLDAWVANEMRDLQQYDRTGTMQPTLASFMSLPPDERAWVARRGVDPVPQPPPTAPPRTPAAPAVTPAAPARTPVPTRGPARPGRTTRSLENVLGNPNTLPGQSQPPPARFVGSRLNANDFTMDEGRTFGGQRDGTRGGTRITSPVVMMLDALIPQDPI